MAVKRIQLISLGCSKNLVDSEHLLAQIEKNGIEIIPEDKDLASEGSLEPVDAVLINTCGFINDAKEESVNTIMRCIGLKKRNIVRSVYVFGCLSQRYGKELEKEIPEVDAFFGVLDVRKILASLGADENDDYHLCRHLTTPKHYAYLKIAEGCDRSCSYCAIPGIRGRYVSYPMEDLVSETEYLASLGVRELIVIAQDTTYYGTDLYGKKMLAPLLSKLCRVEGIEWIRVHYSYPMGFPLDFLDVMRSEPKICKYMDIPLQHSSTKVLKAMRRGVDESQTQAILDKIRKDVPGITIRTTMMVGHPGEDSREFEGLLSFVRKNRFDRLGAFMYSEEEGTYGAAHFKDSVRQSTKQRRYDALMETQQKISLELNERKVGETVTVIVDSYSDGVLLARMSDQSPDVDGGVIINIKKPSGCYMKDDFDPSTLIGNFVKARITGAAEYDLYADFIGPVIE